MCVTERFLLEYMKKTDRIKSKSFTLNLYDSLLVVLTLWPAPVLFLPECVSLQPSSAGNHGRDLAEKRIAFPVGGRQNVSQAWFFYVMILATLCIFCPHLRQRGSFVPSACVAPDGVHQCVGGECVVGGPRAHVLLKALNYRPVGPEGNKSPKNTDETHKHKDGNCQSGRGTRPEPARAAVTEQNQLKP